MGLLGEVAILAVAARGAEMATGGQGGPSQIDRPVIPAWAPLSAGDTVAFVAPSHAEHKEHYGALADTMRQWGLRAVQQADMVIEPGYFLWPNTPERRADHIITALKDPNIKAIVALEGGEGANEVVEMLKKRQPELDALPKRAIPLIGYSDITQLQLFLGQRGLVSPVQGPSIEFLAERVNMDVAQKSIISENQKALQTFLMGAQDKQPAISLMPINQAAQVTPHIKGTLVGGGDIPIALTDQSSHRLSTEGSGSQILFLEGRSSASLHHSLSKLKERKQLGSVDAIVLSRYYDNQQYTGNIAQAYVSEIQKTLQDLDITKPVYFGAPVGHPNSDLYAAPIVPLPLYTQAEITATPEGPTLSVGRFRDITECDYRRSLPHDAPEASAPAKPRSNEASSVVVVPVPITALRIPDVGAAMEKDFAGKKVVLQFGENANIPIMHMALTELQSAGKLSNAQSLLVATTQPVQPEAQAWLQDFQQRHLPAVPVQMAELPDKTMLSTLSGGSPQQPGMSLR